jgi:hypothetical protein
MRTRAALLAVMTVLVFASVCYECLRALFNPIVISREDKSAQVLIDGSPVSFDGQFFSINPWKRSYIVEIRQAATVTKRRIDAWDKSSDSGTISIKKNKVEFYLSNEPVQ